MNVVAPLCEVHLLELPVRLAAKSRRHFEELMREFTLITAEREHGHPEHTVPARLLNLVQTLMQQFAGVTGAAEQRLADAVDRGDAVIDDHVMAVPREAGP